MSFCLKTYIYTHYIHKQLRTRVLTTKICKNKKTENRKCLFYSFGPFCVYVWLKRSFSFFPFLQILFYFFAYIHYFPFFFYVYLFVRSFVCFFFPVVILFYWSFFVVAVTTTRIIVLANFKLFLMFFQQFLTFRGKTTWEFMKQNKWTHDTIILEKEEKI